MTTKNPCLECGKRRGGMYGICEVCSKERLGRVMRDIREKREQRRSRRESALEPEPSGQSALGDFL